MSPRKPTQKEIAEAANVSQGLVSLILSNAEVDVTESTRQRVIETAALLGYTPRARNRSPKTAAPQKRGKLIAYISPSRPGTNRIPGDIFEAYDEFYGKMQNLLVESAHHKRCSLLARPGENLTELTAWLIEWGIDGVILHSNDAKLAAWIAPRYPLVQVNRQLIPEADVVMTNQEELMLIALQHLYDHGHRRIAFGTRPDGDSVIATRHRIYREFLAKHSLPCFDAYLSISGSPQLNDFFFDAAPSDRPTAIITGDPSALLLQREALRRGLTLPRDLSVVGIDNISADIFAHPPLTSIDIPSEQIARTALKLILDRMKEPEHAFQKIEISPRLIVRESVTSPADQNSAHPTPQ